MQQRCNVCEAPLQAPIYESRGEQSLTSLCELHPGTTQVWFCRACGHILSNALAHTDDYYAHDYKILLHHDDEDQIYEVVDGQVIYRTDHQLKVLNTKLPLRDGLKILDYGCAKAAMSAMLLRQIPGLDFHFFDVSDMYRTHWERITSRAQCAVSKTPANWHGRFDVITSYFSLEHIPQPRAAAHHIASLLKDDGVLYAIVPHALDNVADFVVVDHVNHFTPSSLAQVLQQAGLLAVEIDTNSHRGALVVTARKSGHAVRHDAPPGLEVQVQALADFWTALDEQLAAAQSPQAAPCAIYGAGFYGAFIYAHLKNASAIQCFLDQNPHQQGRLLFGVPIVAPQDLPSAVQTLYIGLNPQIARSVIAAQPLLNRPGLQHVFMDALP